MSLNSTSLASELSVISDDRGITDEWMAQMTDREKESLTSTRRPEAVYNQWVPGQSPKSPPKYGMSRLPGAS